MGAGCLFQPFGTMLPSAFSAPMPHGSQHRPRSSHVAIFFKASMTILASALDSGFFVRV